MCVCVRVSCVLSCFLAVVPCCFSLPVVGLLFLGLGLYTASGAAIQGFVSFFLSSCFPPPKLSGTPWWRGVVEDRHFHIMNDESHSHSLPMSFFVLLFFLSVFEGLPDTFTGVGRSFSASSGGAS